MSSSSFISQDYFDELCVENYETFEMTCRQEAVTETLEQIKGQSISHLSLTYPDENNADVRIHIRNMQQALRTLEIEEGICEIEQALETVHLFIRDRDSNELLFHLFLVENGFEIYFTLLNRLSSASPCDACATILVTLQEIIRRSTIFRRAFQNAVPKAMSALLAMYENLRLVEVNNSTCTSFSDLLLETILASVSRCETNKKLWMKSCTETNTFSCLLLLSLENDTSATNESGSCTICRVLTSICTFDDFRSTHDENSLEPISQSCHSHVQTLADEGAVDIVHSFLMNSMETSNVEAISAAVSTLRAMSIQDSIVQRMEKVGVMETSSRLLTEALNSFSTEEEREQKSALVTAALGLFRNASANDNVKSTLCTGKNRGVVVSVIRAMQTYPASQSLQEHACGLVAALALWKPKHATILVEADAHVHVVLAMQRHPQSATLQRQAALALRNMAARSPELHSTILDTAAEDALRTIAAKHISCQDEVYAALRDLGLPVSSLRIQKSDDGQITVHKGRHTFGERNPNFRPVYDD